MAAAHQRNLLVPCREPDNYVVINRQGIVRYHALDLWPHGRAIRERADRVSIRCFPSRLIEDGAVSPAWSHRPIRFGRRRASS